MQKYIISTIVFIFILLSSSCRKDFNTTPSAGDFRIEKDTLFLDSVFTNIASRTYNFKIYNTSNKDIIIRKIGLENGNSSFYRLNVDGTACKSINNVLIHANDSIFVFAEVTADITQLTNPIYEEKLIVEDEITSKHILLTSFVKDAYFLYPRKFADSSKDSITTYTNLSTGETSKIAGFFLHNDTTFTANKPIVIYGHVAVPQGKTLTIEQDAHLYFHFNSGLIVWEGATLKVNGTLGHEVIFEDDRMEPDFENRSGMWNYIWLRANSINNEINYAIIKNAEVGVIVHPTDNTSIPMLQIKNTKIFNHTLVGIFGFSTTIYAENLVMNNFGLSAINLQLGGKYNFTHCTIANYSGGIRNEKSGAVYVNNFYEDTETNTLYATDLEEFNLSNSIIYGNNNIEFYLDKNDNANFNYQIKNNIIRFFDPSSRYNLPSLDFNDATHYTNNLLNANPYFKNVQENEMQVGEQSAGINQGNTSSANAVPFDIIGTNRTSSPDLGAYQHIIFPN